MRPSLVSKAIHTCITADRPLMLWGPPGVGKSSLVAQYAKSNDFDLIDLRLSQLDPVDLRGVPRVDLKTLLTSWAPPDFFPTTGRGIIFLDEVNSASQATQASAYQLILDRRLGKYVLPKEWRIIAAGNRVTDRAIVNQMATPLRNRFTHIEVESNAQDWARWAMTSEICDEVLGFIRFRPEMLNEFAPRPASPQETARMNAVKDARAFASERSWHALSDEFKVGVPKEIELDIYEGNVGTVAATEFMAYLTNARNMPNLDVIMLNPQNARVPTEPSAMYAVSVGLAARVKPENFDRAMMYMNRLPAEFQTLMIKDAEFRTPAIVETKAFQTWALNNGEALI